MKQLFFSKHIFNNYQQKPLHVMFPERNKFTAFTPFSWWFAFTPGSSGDSGDGQRLRSSGWTTGWFTVTKNPWRPGGWCEIAPQLRVGDCCWRFARWSTPSDSIDLYVWPFDRFELKRFKQNPVFRIYKKISELRTVYIFSKELFVSSVILQNCSNGDLNKMEDAAGGSSSCSLETEAVGVV